MSAEDDLLVLARDREAKTNNALSELLLESPDRLLRQLRSDFARQADYRRIKHTDEKLVILSTLHGGLAELACEKATFVSGASLTFDIRLAEGQLGWLVRQFRFHLCLQGRRVKMVRIHLNREPWHDPLTVPRCHLHVDNSNAHVPFPIMNPRLIMHHVCEHLEPDFGT